MNYALKRNDWESTFFGREIAQVAFHTAAGESAQAFSLCTARLATNEFMWLDKLQQDGFELVETELRFAVNFRTDSIKISALELDKLRYVAERHIERATEADIPELQRLFANAFPATRFRPPYFSVEENQRLYARWWEAAVNGEYDDFCLVEKHRKTGEILGAITLRLAQGEVHIGVLAVNPAYHRQGVAKRLLAQAKHWACEQKATHLWAATQLSNGAAIAFFQSQEMWLGGSLYWLYKR